MFVTQHARERLRRRMGAEWADWVSTVLETWDGERGIVAYILADVPPTAAEDGSNGDLLVIVANEGSIETAYFRRSEQDISPAYFGASKVVDRRVYPLVHHYPMGATNDEG